MQNPKMPPKCHRALMLRTCKVMDGKLIAPSPNAGGFEWPRKGYVACPDWKPSKECGNGLHGLLWGEGDPGVWEMNGAWLVCAVDAREIVGVGQKIKAPRAWVVFVGDRETAWAYLREHDVGSACRRGYHSTATLGNRSTATLGDDSTATLGDDSTATLGNRSTATLGNRSTATLGNHSTAIFRWWDGAAGRYRATVMEIDGTAYKANTPYCCINGVISEVSK